MKLSFFIFQGDRVAGMSQTLGGFAEQCVVDEEVRTQLADNNCDDQVKNYCPFDP